MAGVEKLLEGVPPEARQKAAVFIMNRGEAAFKHIFTIEQFNLEDAFEATSECNEEEFALVRDLIKDSYGLDLKELVAGVKRIGSSKVRRAFMELKTKKSKTPSFRFNSQDVFELAARL